MGYSLDSSKIYFHCIIRLFDTVLNIILFLINIPERINNELGKKYIRVHLFLLHQKKVIN